MTVDGWKPERQLCGFGDRGDEAMPAANDGKKLRQ
jgi:hypothetical protein